MSGFADRLAAAEQIQAGLDHASKSSAANQTVFHDWLKSNINLAVSTLTLTSIEDGETLTKLSQQMSSQEIFDRQVIAFAHELKLTLLYTGHYQAQK